MNNQFQSTQCLHTQYLSSIVEEKSITSWSIPEIDTNLVNGVKINKQSIKQRTKRFVAIGYVHFMHFSQRLEEKINILSVYFVQLYNKLRTVK